MSTFDVDCELRYEVAQQTVFLFSILVPSDARQRVSSETVRLDPALHWDELPEPGTPNRLLRADVPTADLRIRYQARVDIGPDDVDAQAPELRLADLPAEAMPYLRPSRYCESDILFDLASRRFGTLPRGRERVEAICRWIRDNVDYVVGASTPMHTACDVLAQRAGVCRDFAHVAVALCRALNIPARFVTGYAHFNDPPADFHAVFEAYLGGRWVLFDPTDLSPVGDLIRIGTGRDASEVPFATFFGSAKLRRLSPLVERATAAKVPVPLQTPGSGVRLAA